MEKFLRIFLLLSKMRIKFSLSFPLAEKTKKSCRRGKGKRDEKMNNWDLNEADCFNIKGIERNFFKEIEIEIKGNNEFK